MCEQSFMTLTLDYVGLGCVSQTWRNNNKNTNDYNRLPFALCAWHPNKSLQGRHGRFANDSVRSNESQRTDSQNKRTDSFFKFFYKKPKYGHVNKRYKQTKLHLP